MQILDKNKDFYDFYQNIYIDKTYTFDRRKSVYFHKEEWNDIFSIVQEIIFIMYCRLGIQDIYIK